MKIKKIIWIIIWTIIFSYTIIYASDVIEDYIQTQSANWKWTNNNQITFSRKKTTYYINVNNDTNLTNDQLRWFYYDNIFWYFRLDWSDNLDNNVHISSTNSESIWSCNKAWKFSWKAYSKYVGFINFNYNNNKFVYYCEDDNKLYWKAYSPLLWTQIFDWIKIRKTKKKVIDSIDDVPDFANDTNEIKENTIDPTIKNYKDYNIWWWDWYKIENAEINEFSPDESTFWIIK
jgi:hypothetical protein